MIFTIGNLKTYSDMFALNGEVMTNKLGRRAPGESDVFPDGYQGGTVFETYESARDYIIKVGQPGFTVFGVEAVWGVDTELDVEIGYPDVHNLLRDAEIVWLDPSTHEPCLHPMGERYADHNDMVLLCKQCGRTWKRKFKTNSLLLPGENN